MQYKLWLHGARPYSWPNAFAPIMAAVGVLFLIHARQNGFAPMGWAHLWDFLGQLDGITLGLCAATAWALTVGVNFANDWGDGMRGVDAQPTGRPLRLTASGAVPAATVRAAAIGVLSAAALLGLALIGRGLLAVAAAWGASAALALAAGLLTTGALCLWAAWRYSCGPRPYGARGWGEVAVFSCYGLVAVLGTALLAALTHEGGAAAWGLNAHLNIAPNITLNSAAFAMASAAAAGVGLLSASVNLINNLRDVDGDARASRHTLAVRLGVQRTRWLWLAMVATAAVLGAWLNPATLAATPWLAAAARLVLRHAPPMQSAAPNPASHPAHTGAALHQALRHTARALLLWALGVGLPLF